MMSQSVSAPVLSLLSMQRSVLRFAVGHDHWSASGVLVVEEISGVNVNHGSSSF